MGVARLLAKAWLLICLFAGAHALVQTASRGGDLVHDVLPLIASILWFAAVGLLFVAGYGASARHGPHPLPRVSARDFIPGFNDAVFLSFVTLSFLVQVFLAPHHMPEFVARALERPIYFLAPGERAVFSALYQCALDGPLDAGRFFSSAFTWLLAIIFVGSAASHLRLASGLVRLERLKHPEVLGAATLALVLGIAAVMGFQLLFMGTLYAWLPCEAYTGIAGQLLLGLAPLLLAYLIVAAVTALLATGREK